MGRKRHQTADTPELDLPAELRALGEPLSVHPPLSVLRAVDRFQAKLKLKLDNPTVERWSLMITGGLFAAGGLALVGVYFFHPPRNENPLWALIPGLIAFALGSV